MLARTRHRTYALAVVLSLSAGSAYAQSAPQGDAPSVAANTERFRRYDLPKMTPETEARLRDIRAKLNEKWESIRSFEVKFTFELREESTKVIGRFREHVILDGAKRYIDKHNGMNAGPSSGRLSRTTSILSDNTTHVIGHGMQQAYSENGPQMITELDGSGFFQLNMLRCPKEPVEGPDARPFCDFLDVHLDFATPVLREHREKLDGIECEVIDLRSIAQPDPYMTIWLDPARNYLPLWTLYQPRASGGATMEFRLLEAIEAAPGLWFGTKATKSNNTFPGPAELRGDEFDDYRKPHTYDMLVATDDAGKPWLYANHTVPPDRFVPKIPESFRQYDADALRNGTSVPMRPAPPK